MLRVVAVDDEPSALANIVRHIDSDPRLDLVGQAGSAAAARRLIEALRPDAVFLDIEMPGGNGFSIIDGIDNAPKIVCVTAHAGHAVEAFQISAIDFLLKPIMRSRFDAAVGRLEKAATLDRLIRDVARRSQLETTIMLSGHREKQLVRTNEVRLLLAEGDYTRLYLAKSSSVLSGQSLGHMAQMLPSPPFVRLSRSVMINLARVVAVRSLKATKVTVRLDDREEPFLLGRAAATKLKQYLARHAVEKRI
ncbi:LytTR family DNA-binding domain-containing protein [Bradyrhizobium prioriisuperbiae]|uniref:LytR/AlgR family response regulator transcription factor n=1 Tax=Bradyrhizobium prioriisuperbiae TaxID=2854389 RepID=UPI0028E47F91|nr:LytTR family DNA-binding domain-containing protein [Bradyrhizobium prioritasuperba]